MKQIAASILGQDHKSELVDSLIHQGINYIHYDVMDGNFVDNVSLPVEEMLKIFNSTKPHYKDVHLMVQYPSKYVEQLIGKVDQISVHYESDKKMIIEEFVNKYSSKTKLGLVVNPDTPVKALFKYLDRLNHVMIMSVIPGRGGQKFIESSIDKIKELRAEADKQGLDLIIEVDGGINDITGPKVFEAGVDVVVSGSYLINNISHGAIQKITK